MECRIHAILRVLRLSGIASVFSNSLHLFALQAIYLLGFGIPFFIDSYEDSQPVKWNLWVAHKLVLTAVYCIILFMYHSRWRERLPGKLFIWVGTCSYLSSDLWLFNFLSFLQQDLHFTIMLLSCSS